MKIRMNDIFLSRLKESQAQLKEENTHPEHEQHSHLSHS